MKKLPKQSKEKTTLIENVDAYSVIPEIEKLTINPDDTSINSVASSNEPPAIFIVKKDKASNSNSRREFIASSLLGGSAISLTFGILSGCKKDDDNSVHKSIFSITTKYWYASFQFSPDGKTIATSGSAESVVNLWSIPEGKLLKAFNNGLHAQVKCVTFTPDGKYLIISVYEKINIWSIPEGILLTTLEEAGTQGYQITQFKISPDGKNIAYQKYPDTSIKICSIPEGKLLNTIDDGGSSRNDFQLNPDVKTISSIYNQTIKIRTFPDGNLLKIIEAGLNDPTAYFKFSPDGKILVTLNNTTIKIWTFPEGNLLKTIESNTTWAHFQFSHDGKMIFSWGSDETIRLWSLPDGNQIKFVMMPPRQFTNAYFIPFSPDDTIYVRSAEVGIINLWSLKDEAWKKTINDEKDNTGLGRHFEFSPDGKILASSRGNKISLWTIPDCTPIVAGPCICNTVCTCNTVSPGNKADVCTCNTVESCTCNSICTCNTVAVCSCDGHSSSSYWFPN